MSRFLQRVLMALAACALVIGACSSDDDDDSTDDEQEETGGESTGDESTDDGGEDAAVGAGFDDPRGYFVETLTQIPGVTEDQANCVFDEIEDDIPESAEEAADFDPTQYQDAFDTCGVEIGG